MLLKNIFFDRASNHHIQFKVDRLQIILVAKKYISIRVGAIRVLTHGYTRNSNLNKYRSARITPEGITYTNHRGLYRGLARSNQPSTSVQNQGCT